MGKRDMVSSFKQLQSAERQQVSVVTEKINVDLIHNGCWHHNSDSSEQGWSTKEAKRSKHLSKFLQLTFYLTVLKISDEK